MRRGVPVFALIVGLVALGFVACVATAWPGYLSYNSVIQLLEGRTARYGNWHPAVMSWLLGLSDAIAPGAAAFIVLDAALFFASFIGLLLLKPRPHWAAAVVAALWMLSPQAVIYQGTVWKDVLFADAAVAGFVCLAAAGAFWSRERLRFGLIAAAVLLLALGTLARQNGAVVAVLGVIAIFWLAVGPQRNWRRAGLYGLAALVAMSAAVLGGKAALGLRTVGDSGPAVQFQLLQTYDVIGAVQKDPSLRLDYVAEDDPRLEKLIRTDGVRAWSPTRNDTLGTVPALEAAIDNADPDAMDAQWRDLVLHHPWLYLRVRADVFRWVFLTPELTLCVPYEVGVDGPPPVMQQLGLAERADARDLAMDAYGKFFIGTPLLSHLFYALLAVFALAILLRRRAPSDIAMAALLLAALGTTASFFIISIACDYRYLYFLDAATMMAVFYLALDAPSAWAALKRKRAPG